MKTGHFAANLPTHQNTTKQSQTWSAMKVICYFFLAPPSSKDLVQGHGKTVYQLWAAAWMMLLKTLMCCCSFVFVFLFFQMQCGQVSITSGMAQSHHHIICWEWEVVSGPSRRPHGEHSSDGVQHSDPKCWCPRWRTLRLLNPHKQETKSYKSASHCSR